MIKSCFKKKFYLKKFNEILLLILILLILCTTNYSKTFELLKMKLLHIFLKNKII